VDNVKANTEQRAVIDVQGVVQGVGFRPFIYRLAVQHKLRGWVRNTSGKVEIEVEGKEAEVADFLPATGNPTSRWLASNISGQLFPRLRDMQTSHILQVFPEGINTSLFRRISQPVRLRNEIFNPADRRYHIPSRTVPTAGPRFTIIEDIPYDRPKTTMRAFQMCPRCQKEYQDPLNRRFHAQPNACPIAALNWNWLT